MNVANIRNIAVLGSGIMGHGIAQSFLMGNCQVILYDIEASVLETARAHIEKNLKLLEEAGLLTTEDVGSALNRLSTTIDLKKAVAECDFIIEAAPENLELKQDLFQQVEAHCRESAILATNTSSFTLTAIGLNVKKKERLVTAHWFNPPYIVPVVEVVRGDETSDHTFDTTFGLLEKIGKTPVRIQADIPGFLVNRISGAMTREILDLYEKGVANAEDIDRAIKGTIGFQFASIGPLQRMDFGGLDLWLKGCENAFATLNNSTEAPPALRRLVSQGDLGVKSGRGFFEYTADLSQNDLDEAILKRDRDMIGQLKHDYLKNKE